MRDIPLSKLGMAACAIAWAVAMFSVLTRDPVPRVADGKVTAFAKATLGDLQARSFSQNREYCGMIYQDREGTLFTGRVFEGDRDTCNIAWERKAGRVPIASFHTHGSHDEGFDNEVPSIQDLTTDIGDNIDGFVTTPGGRLWRNDWESETASLICGEGCVAKDPEYRRCDGFTPRSSYSL